MVERKMLKAILVCDDETLDSLIRICETVIENNIYSDYEEIFNRAKKHNAMENAGKIAKMITMDTLKIISKQL